MSSHALRVVHAGSLGVGGICSCPDGCDWDTGAEWHETVGQVEDDHARHIEQEERILSKQRATLRAEGAG